ncbi:hypothetical protein JOB18_025752 [Solea senegalensis]|uniref:Uncharacterized protein n=1 Tax=Solea senegalensis TaxID=28829 RepID=A0AAV6PS88_SOLSE|nr:hypothetical protein JOB18_025752 [Solea senegalensis]
MSPRQRAVAVSGATRACCIDANPGPGLVRSPLPTAGREARSTPRGPDRLSPVESVPFARSGSIRLAEEEPGEKRNKRAPRLWKKERERDVVAAVKKVSRVPSATFPHRELEAKKKKKKRPKRLTFSSHRQLRGIHPLE